MLVLVAMFVALVAVMVIFLYLRQVATCHSEEYQYTRRATHHVHPVHATLNPGDYLMKVDCHDATYLTPSPISPTHSDCDGDSYDVMLPSFSASMPKKAKHSGSRRTTTSPQPILGIVPPVAARTANGLLRPTPISLGTAPISTMTALAPLASRYGVPGHVLYRNSSDEQLLGADAPSNNHNSNSNGSNSNNSSSNNGNSAIQQRHPFTRQPSTNWISGHVTL